MAKLIALDIFTYKGRREPGELFEVHSDVHVKQLLSRGLAELHNGGNVQKKTFSPSSPVAPAPVSVMSNILDVGEKKPRKRKNAKRLQSTTPTS